MLDKLLFFFAECSTTSIRIDDHGSTAVVEYQPITEYEVKSAVKRSKSGKAPGCDIIPNEVYKAGEHEMVRRLTAIFNQAHREGCVPTQWGQAEICQIYKQKNCTRTSSLSAACMCGLR